MQYAVETFSLTKIFSDWWGRAKVYAVDDLNLKIRSNEVYGLLGPNGSGKSTTIKMLLGLLYPTKGKSVILGGDGADPQINSRIGFLPEESYLYRYLNARETLDFYGRLFGLPVKVRRMRIEALLDMVGLKAVANRPVGTFSKGMARRIGLAQALINDPDLLILDEPTTGLDPIGTRQIKDLILKLAQRGKTILLCSHLLADVEDVCDRISILYGGRIQIEGRVKELLQQTNKRQITMDALSEDTIDKIRQIIQSQGAECEITSPIDRLETFFIKTVATAQQKEHPTSGAVSTTKIGDFLTQERPVENILDELVSSPESKDISSEVIQTEKVVTPGSSASEPNERMLSNLTQQAESEQVVDTEEVTTEPVDSHNQETQQDQIKKNILDQLVDNSNSQNKDVGESEKPQAGESGDA